MANLQIISNLTRRTESQTKFLLDMLHGDYELLILLERKMKHTHTSYCPSDMGEVCKILESHEVPDSHKLYDWLTIDLVMALDKYPNIVRQPLSGRFGVVNCELAEKEEVILKDSKGVVYSHDKGFPEQWKIFWLSWNEGVPLRKEHRMYDRYARYAHYSWNSKESVSLIKGPIEL